MKTRTKVLIAVGATATVAFAQFGGIKGEDEMSEHTYLTAAWYPK